MGSNKYHFVTDWSVDGDVVTVSDLISKPELLTLWWPSVYLDIEKKREDQRDVYHLFTKGWLPYTLRWRFHVIEADLPRRLELRAEGDLTGVGVWTFAQDGERVRVRYEWEVDANKPILRLLSFALKPFFSMNHVWAMKMGEESLKLELARQKAGRSRRDAPPPQATFGYRHHWERNLQRAGE